MVECQLPKLDVAGSTPVTRSTLPSTNDKSSAGRKRMRCPTCGVEFERAESRFAPFCSRRCKLIDLGDWFDERFRIAGEAVPDEGEKEPDDET